VEGVGKVLTLHMADLVASFSMILLFTDQVMIVD
jgi:hypothetical protein